MRVSAQRSSQRSRYACAASGLSKRSPRSGALRVIDAALDLALAIGVPRPTRERDDAVVREQIAVERVQRRVVDVGREHALLQVVEDDRAGHAAEPAEGLLVQPGPHLAARAPGEQPDRLAAVAQRQDEEPHPAVLPRLGVAHHRPVAAVVDLGLLSRPPSRSRDGRRAAARPARPAAGARSAARWRSRRGSRGRRRDRGRSPRRRGRRASACSIASRYGSHALAWGLRPGGRRPGRRRRSRR